MSDATKPTPVRTAGAIAEFAAYLAGGLTTVAGLTDIPMLATITGVVILVAGGVTRVLIPKLEGRVIPAVDAVAYLDGDRKIVTGPAGTVVDVDHSDAG